MYASKTELYIRCEICHISKMSFRGGMVFMGSLRCTAHSNSSKYNLTFAFIHIWISISGYLNGELWERAGKSFLKNSTRQAQVSAMPAFAYCKLRGMPKE